MILRKNRRSGLHPNLLFLTDPDSPILESYRRVYRKILFLHKQDGLKSIGVTSSQVSEGKTITSINLSLAIAEDVSKRVALLDCDFRRPQVGGYLGIRSDHGLAEVISGKKELNEVRVTLGEKRSNLEVFPAGRLEQEIYPMFYNHKVKPILTMFRDIYDFIIVDNPPIMPISDEEFLADLLDAIVLVIRAGKTPRDLVNTALESMEGKNIIGILCNGIKRQLSSYHYHGYYKDRYYRSGTNK